VRAWPHTSPSGSPPIEACRPALALRLLSRSKGAVGWAACAVRAGRAVWAVCAVRAVSSVGIASIAGSAASVGCCETQPVRAMCVYGVQAVRADVRLGAVWQHGPHGLCMQAGCCLAMLHMQGCKARGTRPRQPRHPRLPSLVHPCSHSLHIHGWATWVCAPETPAAWLYALGPKGQPLPCTPPPAPNHEAAARCCARPCLPPLTTPTPPTQSPRAWRGWRRAWRGWA